MGVVDQAGEMFERAPRERGLTGEALLQDPRDQGCVQTLPATDMTQVRIPL